MDLAAATKKTAPAVIDWTGGGTALSEGWIHVPSGGLADLTGLPGCPEFLSR